MKPSNYLKAFLGISVFWLSLLHESTSQFLSPPIEPIPDAPEGVTVEEVGPNWHITILENVPQNPINPIEECVRIAKINVADTNNPFVNVSLITIYLPQDPFKVEQNGPDWFLCMQQGVDYEFIANNPSGTLQLKEYTSGNIASIILTFIDVNDNEVQITGYSPALEEAYDEKKIYDGNVEVGYITTILWRDDDKMDQDKITFELEHTVGGDGFFEIDPNGKIYQVKTMDYQKSPTHRLKITVFDSDKLHSNSIPLTIDVQDIPDLPPVWNFLPPMLNIDEFSKIPDDPVISTIQASDGDTGLRWDISYELEETGHDGISDYFTINPTNGSIIATREIDAEELFYESASQTLSFELRVTAKEVVPSGFDPGLGLSISATITVNIGDINDNDPEVCTDEAFPWNDRCSTPPYVFNLVEHSVGTLPLPQPFVIRDIDATLPFSKYEVKFAANTDGRIVDSFDIQPNRESSGITQYFLTVKDSSAIDYESDDKFWLTPIGFTITATDSASKNSVDATFEVTLQDINDNSPIFENEAGQPVIEYRFYVCENLVSGYVLQKITPDTGTLNLCPGLGSGTDPIRIIAKDKDVSEEFNTVNYRWSSTRLPPLDLNKVTGEMTINNEVNFDFERLDQEVYLVEAYDNPDDPNNQRKETITVYFEVLDVNDSPPDLRITPTRISVDENFPVGTIVDPDLLIAATDVDVSASLTVDIKPVQSFVRNAGTYMNNTLDETCMDIIEQWFEPENIQRSPGPNGIGQILTAQLKIGSKSPDREEKACGGVDRVDLTVTVTDINQDPRFGNGVASQTLTIIINDLNDEPPEWEGDGLIEAVVYETRDFASDPDDASPLQREIVTLRVTDPDADITTFEFSIETTTDCVAFCDEMESLVELDADGAGGNVNTNGRLVLRRKLNVMIDREETKFYGNGIQTDFLKYTLTVSDGVHESSIDISINVLDINDNVPVWVGDYPGETVNEGFQDVAIEQFYATDEDAGTFGKVSYIFHEDSVKEGIEDYFKLDVNTGILSTKPDVSYTWSATFNSFNFIVVAIDNYLGPGVNLNSLSAPMPYTVTIKDSNDNPPEFIRDAGEEVASQKETEVETGTKLPAIGGDLEIRDRDDPLTDNNGVFSVEITRIIWKQGDRDEEVENSTLFRAVKRPQPVDAVDNRWAVDIFPDDTTNFVGKWGIYTVTFEATDEGKPEPLSDTRTYTIKIINENLNTPEFIYPKADKSTTILVGTSSNTLPGTRVKMFNEDLVPFIVAEDKDDEENGNGKLTYSIKPLEDEPDLNDGSEFFDLREENEGWSLVLKQSLENSQDVSFYTLSLEVQDMPTESEARSSETRLRIYLTTGSNRQPVFNDTSPQNVIIPENKIGHKVALREAYDPDEGLIDDPEFGEYFGNQSIIYNIIEGSDKFGIVYDDNGKASLTTVEELDREDIDRYEIVVQVTNPDSDMIPPDPRGSITVIIEVEDEIDNAPIFVQTGIISGGISPSTDQYSVVVTAEVTDLDKDDPVTFSISQATPSNPNLPENPVSIIESGNYTALIRIEFAPQPSMTGYYTFELTARDSGDLSTTKQVKIYFIKPSNVIDFRFFNRRDQVEEKRARVSEILTDSFGYRCNVDRVNDDGNNVNLTILKTHFVDLVKNEPVEAVYISEQQYDPLTYSKLLSSLAAEGIVLNSNGIGNQDSAESDNSDKLMIYLLIGGVGVLAIVLIVMSTTCFFNNRSLQRRVRSLTATTFGSQSSGLNRVGATMELPNTNEFAIEGSNPMWSKNPADRERKVPAFDAESIGSGGSVLIGVEDDDDFKNYKGTSNPIGNVDSDGNLDNSDEDYTRDIYDNTSPSKNALYESDNVSNDSDGSPPELSLPPTSRRNPLLDM